MENKRGVNLELIYDEISRDERNKEQRKEQKKLKKVISIIYMGFFEMNVFMIYFSERNVLKENNSKKMMTVLPYLVRIVRQNQKIAFVYPVKKRMTMKFHLFPRIIC